MDSYNVFRSIVDKYVVFHAKFVGFNALDPHFKPTARTYIFLALWSILSLLSIYTIFTSEFGIVLQNVFLLLFISQVNFNSMLF